MEENEQSQPDKEYIKGFNEGYTLAQYMPDTAEKVASSTEQSERSQGFRDGWKEFQIEKTKDNSRLINRMRERINPSRESKDKDLERE